MVLGAAHRSFDFLFSGAFPDNWAARHCSYGEEMTDRELLEMAAKAAGICGHYACHHPQFDNDWEEPGIWFVDKNDCTSCWNPLTDDGDALRLAVKLGIDLLFSPEDVEAVAAQNAKENDGEMLAPWAWESWTLKNQDPYAATRRAIVRAAAEIGKEMK